MKPTTFAPTIVGSRKIESGSSGLLARCSLMTNSDHQHGRDGEEAERTGREPVVLVGLDDRVDEQREAGRDEHRADQVEGADGVLHAALVEQARREQDGREADRRVDEEDPFPADVLREHAAQQHAHRSAGSGDGTPHGQRLVALVALGERRGEDRERRGRDHRGAETLNRARADQEVAGCGKAAGQRCDREDGQTGHEQPATAEQVGTPAAQQQEPAERQRVGARDPLQARVGEVQIDLDRRQRDVDDRDVDDEHELRRTEQDQRDPAARIGGFRRHWLLSQEVVSQQYDPARADVNNVRRRGLYSECS